jgi:N-acetylmuramoyl-L-alanine amidase
MNGAARAALALVAPVAMLALATGARASSPPMPQSLDQAAVHMVEGAPYIGANDLARLLDAARFWHADVRKLELRAGAHRVQLTADNPFVIVDEATLRLALPVRSLRGELQAPVALLDSLPHDSTLARLLYDPRHAVVLVVPAGGVVGTPRVGTLDGVTRVTFPADEPWDARVVGRARAHFTLRFGGFFAGVIPDTTRAGLLRNLRPLGAVTGCAFELRIAPEAIAYRLIREGGRVTLELARSGGASWESFAPEGPSGPRALRVIVLDPGHGGADAGVTAGNAQEKDLALVLAKKLRTEIERRVKVRVVLTRDDDRALNVGQRAEAANRARADLVISLHFDGYPSPRAAGASAYCTPAVFGGGAGGEAGGFRSGEATPLAVLPWRDVAARWAVPSRALAEAVLGSLELRGGGPTRLHELLPSELLGVNAPGMLLECATLTNPADRRRVTDEEGMNALALAIADGVEAWQRNE